ncbi:MAG TPA: UbiA family prenyltransferase [Nitrososphaeraceae archaeon]
MTRSNFENKKIYDIDDGCAYPKQCKQIKDIFQMLIYYVKTRTPPVYCYPIATILSFLLISKSHMLENGLVAFGIGIASYFLALATYVYNDITDIDVDRVNRKDQSSVTRNQSKRKLIILVIFLFSLAATISYVISILAFIISIIFIVLGVIYSHPAFSLKSRFPLKTIVTAIGAGLLSLLGGVAAISNGSGNDTSDGSTVLPISTIYLASSFALFYFIQSPLGDIADIKGDRAVGRNTFPLVLGLNGTLAVMISVPFIILAMNGLCFSTMHISIDGTIAIVSTSLIVVGFIGWISNRLHDPFLVKSKRNNVRYLNILMQISILIALI